MPTASEHAFVQFRNGLVLPVEPVKLALDLEARGLWMTVDGHDLVVGPRGQCTAEERIAIKRWKFHLIALLQLPDTQETVQ